MEEIRILAINTSPRKGRNTQQLAEAVLEGCRAVETDEQERGWKIVTEMVEVGDAPADGFQLCRGCWSCVKTGRCILTPDFVTEIYEKIRQADGVVFASPVFFCDVSAQCKIILDRSLGRIPLGAGKASAVAITCGSVGVNSALHTLQGFCSMQGFLDAGWVATYGKTEDKVQGRQVAHTLGRKLVRLAVMAKREMRDAEASGNEALKKDLQHCNHFAYGTHTF